MAKGTLKEVRAAIRGWKDEIESADREIEELERRLGAARDRQADLEELVQRGLAKELQLEREGAG